MYQVLHVNMTPWSIWYIQDERLLLSIPLSSPIIDACDVPCRQARTTTEFQLRTDIHLAHHETPELNNV